MMRKVRDLIASAPFQYCSLASSTTRSPFFQSTNLKGPVPTGLRATWASPFSRVYFGASMLKFE